MIDERVRDRTGAGIARGSVGAANDVLAVVPHHGACAAVDVHGLHSVVPLQNLCALVDVGSENALGVKTALNDEQQHFVFIRLADADTGIELDPVVVLQDLAVDDDGRLELGRVASIFADFLVDLFDVDEVVRVDLQTVVLEVRV